MKTTVEIITERWRNPSGDLRCGIENARIDIAYLVSIVEIQNEAHQTATHLFENMLRCTSMEEIRIFQKAFDGYRELQEAFNK
jgi:stress-induced morphogen